MRVCVVFADAFQWDCFQNMEKYESEEKYYQYKLTPGIAYSSNLHYQIFQGKTPDDVGFFCDYSYCGGQKKKTNAFQNAMDRIPAVNTIARWMLRKTKLMEGGNIPFCEQNAFRCSGRYLFKQRGEISVFCRRVKIANELHYNADTAFDAAERLLDEDEENIVTVINQLDHLGHEYGASSPQYRDAAVHIRDRSIKLFHAFEKKYPGSLCVLLSDHGMSDVYSGVDVVSRLYEKYGLPGNGYLYLNDSVYLRLWFQDKNLKQLIQKDLDKIDVLQRIDHEELVGYGVTAPEFGELIYRLKEGYIFSPNCFDVFVKRIPAGMHGFMEHSDTASGMVMSNIPLSESRSLAANEVFNVICEVLKKAEFDAVKHRD